MENSLAEPDCEISSFEKIRHVDQEIGDSLSASFTPLPHCGTKPYDTFLLSYPMVCA
jgi:hypothetical protein